MDTFIQWLKNDEVLEEGSDYTRYSIEASYRSNKDEILKAFAKICLGYVSAGMKNANYHVRQVFDQDPVRIMISTRNWDDGEWVAVVSWNPHKRCFIISKGFFNKNRKTVSVQSSKESSAENAADIVKELKNMMFDLKDKPDRHIEKLKKVPLKSGPKLSVGRKK